MKPTVISADAMFEEFRGSLRWEWLAGLGASERQFDPEVISRAQSAADLVGYLNYIHPYRVQILGAREVSYLTRGSPEDCARRIARIVTLEPPMLVLADGQAAPDEQPVVLLIFLLVPEAATQKHLEILSEIAELLSDSALREQLKTSTDAAALHQLIASWHSAHEVSS